MQSGFLSATFAAIVALVGTAAPPDSDLGWLASLPGIERGQTTRIGATDRTVYTVSGDFEPVYQQLAMAFAEHGWTVRRSRGLASLDVDPEGQDMRSLRATKGQAAVRVLVRRSQGRQTLLVLTQPPAAGGAVAKGGAGVPAPGASTAAKIAPGAQVMIKEDGLTRTLACADFDAVSVSGNRNRLTLTGACDSLEVLGTGNQIDVKGSVDQVAALGQDNVVTWSPAANPVPPRVGLLGQGNKVDPSKEPTPAPAGKPAQKPAAKSARKPTKGR